MSWLAVYSTQRIMHIPELCYQAQERLLGKNQQVDYSNAPAPRGFKYLLVLVDTFTGWTEAIPWQTERSKEVVKALLKEIIPRFGLPRTFQSDNGSAFTAALIKRVEWLSKLGGSYILHGDHSPEKKQNDVIKSQKIPRPNCAKKAPIRPDLNYYQLP